MVVVDKYMAASVLKQELIDEMKRLHTKARQTATSLAALRTRNMPGVPARKAQIV